ncbi:MAG: HAD-IA family hydrolase [Maritimibacter sp.]|nr:HAD-IA family hydrolase [Maritimibacter sp.]
MTETLPELSLVIFDMDGTLVDSGSLILEVFARTFATVGHPVPEPQDVLTLLGLSLPVLMARLMPEADAATLARAVAVHKAGFVALRQERGAAAAPLFAGARAEIERLAAIPEVLIGAATGMARRGLDHVLAVHGFERAFVTRQCADGHPSKPHPSMLEAALAETGVAAGRAVMIGDTTYDMEMAANAGIAGIGVSWGHHRPAELLAAGARIVVEDFAGLARAVDSFREGGR